MRPRDAAGKIRRRLAAEQIADLVSIEKKTKALTKELKEMVVATGSTLMELPGVGPVVAARTLADTGDIARFADRTAAAAHVAGIDAVLGQCIGAFRMFSQQLVPIEMEVADDGYADAHLREAVPDRSHCRGGRCLVDRDAHQLGTRARQRLDLLRGAFDVRRIGVGHRLDHDGRRNVQRMAVAQMDVPVGRVVYTPLLNEAGGIKSDLTIMRLGRDHFRVVTGGAHGMGDRKWFRDHLPADGSAQLFDATSTLTTLGIWGPRARDVLAATTSDDVSNEGFPFGTARTIEVGGMPVLASRISYVGELGWELYVPMEQGARLWDTLWEAGQPYGIIPFGIGVYGTTGRLEKGYRAHGAELELEWDLVEADMLRPKVKEADFIGREAYLEQRSRPPVATLCTLTVDDNTSSSGVKRYMLGREPILTLDGEPITDAKGRRSFVTSAGSGPSSESTSCCRTCRPSTRRSARSSSSSTSASAIR